MENGHTQYVGGMLAQEGKDRAKDDDLCCSVFSVFRICLRHLLVFSGRMLYLLLILVGLG